MSTERASSAEEVDYEAMPIDTGLGINMVAGALVRRPFQVCIDELTSLLS